MRRNWNPCLPAMLGRATMPSFLRAAKCLAGKIKAYVIRRFAQNDNENFLASCNAASDIHHL
jgi:hypothetical protein